MERMADEKPESKKDEKKKKVPWGTLVWTGVTGALLFRCFYHPSRAVIEQGVVTSCPGSNPCHPDLRIDARPGETSMVYALTKGRVLLSGTSLAIASSIEPVVINYGQQLIQPLVQDGEDVGIGTPLGLMTEVMLTITEFVRSGSSVTKRQVEPAAWLAARGMGISRKGNVKSSLWCTRGRTLEMPSAVATCNIKLPKPPGFMLLPVSVTTT